MKETDTLSIKFSSLGTTDSLKEFLGSNIPKEALCRPIKSYYAFKLGEYVDSRDYESITKLEGLMELHNLIQGNEETQE